MSDPKLKIVPKMSPESLLELERFLLELAAQIDDSIAKLATVGSSLSEAAEAVKKSGGKS